jgi:hypothetical protein
LVQSVSEMTGDGGRGKIQGDRDLGEVTVSEQDERQRRPLSGRQHRARGAGVVGVVGTGVSPGQAESFAGSDVAEAAVIDGWREECE